MEVSIDNRQSNIIINDEHIKTIREVCSKAAHYEGYEDVEVSISIVDDNEIHMLNKKYRNVDRATDVLSFPLMDFENGEASIEEATDVIMIGDIVISAQRAAEQAEQYNHSFERELAYLTVHGMLHLLGYDHIKEEDAVIMRKKEENILNELGLKRI